MSAAYALAPVVPAAGEVAPAPGGCRERTAASRRRLVEDAIGAMRQQLSEPLSLRAIARSAASSPYHFDRIFRQVTGVPPFRFLAALRLDAARRLLLTTGYSATSICFEVGYSSVGSFTRQFSELVGMPPHRLRCFAAAGSGTASLARAHEVDAEAPAADEGAVAGWIDAPDDFQGVIFVGLFATPMPSGRPVACALLRGPGPFRTRGVPDGTYHLFAAGVALPDSGGEAGGLLQDAVLRGACGPVEVRDGQGGPVRATLRPAAPTDPPILVSLPVLLSERLRAAGAAPAVALTPP